MKICSEILNELLNQKEVVAAVVGGVFVLVSSFIAVCGVRAQIRSANEQKSLEFKSSLKRELYLNFIDALLAYRCEFRYLPKLYFEKSDKNILDALLLLEQSLNKLSIAASFELLEKTKSILEHTTTEYFRDLLSDYGYIESRKCFANTKLGDALTKVCENSYFCYKNANDEVSERLKKLSLEPRRLEMLVDFDKKCDELIKLIQEELKVN